MKLDRLLKMSFSSILSNKTRAFLTMLGIIIGIFSVIVLVGVGNGAKNNIKAQIESLGTNLITVNITDKRFYNISNKDINSLITKPGIKEIAPLISDNSINVKSKTKSYTTNLQATTPEYSEVKKTYVQKGRFITQVDIQNRSKVAIVGTDVANELYGTINIVGEKININGIEFSIIGVLESQGSSTLGSSDDMVILPISTAERLLKNTQIRTFYVEANSQDNVDLAKEYLQLFFNKKFKNNTDSFRIFDQASLLTTASKTTSSMTAMLGGIAAISLIVGGIGIMNIMLVSVIERTREIGIRKALGAKRKAILTQFLIESASISLLGGVLGIFLSYVIAYTIERFFKISIAISTNTVLLAVIFSIAVGIVFGMYPANKASKLNPIDALRYE